MQLGATQLVVFWWLSVAGVSSTNVPAPGPQIDYRDAVGKFDNAVCPPKSLVKVNGEGEGDEGGSICSVFDLSTAKQHCDFRPNCYSYAWSSKQACVTLCKVCACSASVLPFTTLG
jgi:hypothetical protein